MRDQGSGEGMGLLYFLCLAFPVLGTGGISSPCPRHLQKETGEGSGLPLESPMSPSLQNDPAPLQPAATPRTAGLGTARSGSDEGLPYILRGPRNYCSCLGRAEDSVWEGHLGDKSRSPVGVRECAGRKEAWEAGALPGALQWRSLRSRRPRAEPRRQLQLQTCLR